jgi:uncharacterized surface protein with fasciclin (FAS1) repeats
MPSNSPSPRDADAKRAPSPDRAPSNLAKPARPERSTRNGGRPSNPHEHDIMTTAAGSVRLKIFVDLLRASGLTEMLQGDGFFTIFAPTDRAFDRIAGRDLQALKADTGRLTEVLGHHVVQGRVKAPKLESPRSAKPVNGADLTLTASADAYRVNEARLVQTNIRASNGVIHAIDKLLVLA